MSLKQCRAFYSVPCRRTYSDTWNVSCIFMSVIFSAPFVLIQLAAEYSIVIN